MQPGEMLPYGDHLVSPFKGVNALKVCFKDIKVLYFILSVFSVSGSTFMPQCFTQWENDFIIYQLKNMT